MRSPSPPPILTAARDLLARYDVLFCDVWGVIHDGFRAYPGAMRALTAFRRNGGTVVLVSNAPVPAQRVAEMLADKGVGVESYDAIVSSGAIALEHVAARAYRSVYVIGPRDRDAAFMDKLPARMVAMGEAEAIVCTGLNDDVTETVADYAGVLEQGRDLGLPFVCANPDLVVDVGGRHYVCAGALGEAYAALGGDVYWAGKPHPSAYATALARAEAIRGKAVPKSRILAIGDAIRTDLKAAELAGVDAFFVTSGIHRAETMTGAAVDLDKLAQALGPGSPPAVAATALLDW
ncbi:MAG: TIGR01459 family HAD-type hydrolase [Hyphomicrobium sp.]|nr:TIGR01459 family HAD-type hydrolase [Hyphomicrobium sp.]PPD07046.1 MAG: TIGR01459 family HAD-type hydrolase [Hyphomicrobium sp.]